MRILSCRCTVSKGSYVDELKCARQDGTRPTWTEKTFNNKNKDNHNNKTKACSATSGWSQLDVLFSGTAV